MRWLRCTADCTASDMLMGRLRAHLDASQAWDMPAGEAVHVSAQLLTVLSAVQALGMMTGTCRRGRQSPMSSLLPPGGAAAICR